ncbi:O-antigen ligase family protein [Natronorubrum daqingense]|uniref:O-Antigen ligase n=1 Tax=Natronorubrum daqingense TaxID=588898 RepID=A0A1N7FM41_9EURY|nr:O-antigen ligase family protein [Natronorubrum daqingense]APX98386.1 O-antigen polymerase [Natronorubrum daqingense]SIS01363.1 O-Antigen ligase [Natronorubrum daqingense]
MSTAERDPVTVFTHDWSIARVANGVIYGLFGVYLVLVLLAHTTDSVLAWHLAASTVVLGAILGCRWAVDAFQDARYLWASVLSVLGVSLLTLWMVYQSSSPGLGPGSNRSLGIVVVFLLTIAFFLVVTDAEQYGARDWAAIACFGVLAGVYLAHSLEYYPSSSQSRWPLWAAVVMGSSLFVLPRLVPERVFLWILPRLAAVVVVLGLATYSVGDYTLWLFEVRQYPGSSPSVPGFDPDVMTLQSIFPNPNGLGFLSFAGFVAAAIDFHRSVVAERPISATITAVLAGICGLGLFLSNARAAMLAAAVALVIYVSYAVGGRRVVPVVVASTLLGLFGLIAGMYVDFIGISATNRFELWSASVSAIRDGPLLFGYGSGSESAVIEPYLAGDGAPTPHNSYLSVIIQTGLVGGLAYVGLVAGSIVAGAIDYENVNVAILAFATGWAVHQFFESYTMFDWSLGAVLAALTLGYLLVDD